MAAKYQKFVLGSKVPMWIGEFGAFMKDHSAEDWLGDAKRLFDKYQVGWAGNVNSAVDSSESCDCKKSVDNA